MHYVKKQVFRYLKDCAPEKRVTEHKVGSWFYTAVREHIGNSGHDEKCDSIIILDYETTRTCSCPEK